MKFLALLALVSAAIATPLALYDNGQSPLGDVLPTEYPGFDLDLSAPRLVQLEGQEEPVVMSELEKIQAKAQGIRFFDVTETTDLGSRAQFRAAAKPSYPTPSHNESVRAVIDTLEIQNLRDGLDKFTSFRTRYYRSDTGKQSQTWLLNKITELTKEFAPKALADSISIQEFPHTWTQSSIIVRVNGTSADDDGVVIIGAHQDSTNNWPFLPAPGADDDGSGSMSILEAYRALIAAGWQPERAVEFHWYAAEEGGLLGSQAVARSYESRNVNVVAMSQYDMTAFVKRGTREQVGIITDFTDPDLTQFNKDLVDLYLDIPWVDTQCGYACSDHASWRKAGYPSVFTIESSFPESNHQYIHTSNDRYDISDEFSFEHMREFSKLAVGFAVELGGWSKSS
ncbi:peptidase [Lentinus tigrinus ALCF2SS1-7]|uniref:Peptide hydrolase n=1 Tax=Lentinus tigrinus ALCF2SS1-6 TaxID=1328759 RepID=A0A5C2SDW4_9APHY|nr:peptidase [Lentinus tigrinus ALCF2SS1-6]RPD74427.1 peptidase [Lentinus tigrinus ALCF2SS1-7]